MAYTIKMSDAEMNALEHLAAVSGMDCWFGITDHGVVYDRENGARFMDPKHAIYELIDGATEYDIQEIGHYDSLTIMNLLARLMITKFDGETLPKETK